jgi:hypothetical protein
MSIIHLGFALEITQKVGFSSALLVIFDVANAVRFDC